MAIKKTKITKEDIEKISTDLVKAEEYDDSIKSKIKDSDIIHYFNICLQEYQKKYMIE